MSAAHLALARRTVLVTGTTSGIGRATADLLRDRGWWVFAGFRRAGYDAALRQAGLTPVRIDYADPDSIAAGFESVLSATGGRLGALVNNGAYAQLGAVEDLPVAALRHQFEVNLFGWHDLTRRAVAAMRSEREGRIVQVSSVLGYVSGRHRGAYAASKHALEALTDALRLELAGTGIRVVLIEPGPVRTGFVPAALAATRAAVDIDGSPHRADYARHLATLVGRDASPLSIPPEAVAIRIAAALDQPRPPARIRVGSVALAAWYLRRLAPTALLDRILDRR